MSYHVPKEFKALELVVTAGVPLLVVAMLSSAAGAKVGSLTTVLAAVLAAAATSALVTLARLMLRLGTKGRPYSSAFFGWSAVGGCLLSAAACWLVI